MQFGDEKIVAIVTIISVLLLILFLTLLIIFCKGRLHQCFHSLGFTKLAACLQRFGWGRPSAERRMTQEEVVGRMKQMIRER